MTLQKIIFNHKKCSQEPVVSDSMYIMCITTPRGVIKK